jgi:hypothetical protein
MQRFFFSYNFRVNWPTANSSFAKPSRFPGEFSWNPQSSPLWDELTAFFDVRIDYFPTNPLSGWTAFCKLTFSVQIL